MNKKGYMKFGRIVIVLVIALIGLFPMAVATGDSDSQKETYKLFKDLVQPIIDLLKWPMVPIIAGISVIAATLGPLFGLVDEEAKKRIVHFIKWAVIAELILTVFWPIVKLFGTIGGRA